MSQLLGVNLLISDTHGHACCSTISCEASYEYVQGGSKIPNDLSCVRPERLFVVFPDTNPNSTIKPMLIQLNSYTVEVAANPRLKPSEISHSLLMRYKIWVDQVFLLFLFHK